MSLVFFGVTAKLGALIADASTDSNYNPDAALISMDVTFTPKIQQGDVLRVFDATPPTMYVPMPITAQVDSTDGILKLRTTPDAGGSGTYAPLRLLGNSDSLDLDAPLYYEFTFSNIRIDNRPSSYKITGGAFQAPNTDTTIDLIDYMRATGQTASGVTRIAPGAVRLEDGDVVFSFGGVDIPSAIPFEPSFTSSEITDATTVGKAVMTATDAAEARKAVGAGSPGSTPADQAATAAALKAHLWVDWNAGIYQRDGVDAAASSAITHNTTTSRPFLNLNPSTSNEFQVAGGGTKGVIGSGGALPTGWTIYNPGNSEITVKASQVAAAFDVELWTTIPAVAETPPHYMGFSSHNITGANSGTRHVSFFLYVEGSDLESLMTQVSWETGGQASPIFYGGGGGRINLELPASSSATDKIRFQFTNASATIPLAVKILVKEVSCYVPAVTGGLRRDVQPVVYGGSTLAARDVTVSVGAGDYFVFAWTIERGIVGERVTVSGSSFSLRSVVGNGRVTKLAVWKVADYVDGAIEAVEPPVYESIDKFNTALLERTSPYITSTGRMRSQVSGQPSWFVSTNRFGRSRIEVRPGEHAEPWDAEDPDGGLVYQQRAEVLSDEMLPYDTPIWTSFAFKTDMSCSDVDDLGIIWQWLEVQVPGRDPISPCLTVQLRLNGQLGVYTLSGTDETGVTPPTASSRWLGRYKVGEWNRWVMRTVFNNTTGGGELSMWLNGTALTDLAPSAGVGTALPTGIAPHYGLYAPTGNSKNTVVIDRANVEWGTTDLSSRVTSPLPI